MEFSNTPNGFLIAVGQGPDPVNDGWYTYRFRKNTYVDVVSGFPMCAMFQNTVPI